MESLLCDEVWLSSPAGDQSEGSIPDECVGSFWKNEEELTQCFMVCVEKEVSYMPESDYVQNLKSNNILILARYKAIQWFLECRHQLNLSFGTIFYATNYFDRFLSSKCNIDWKCWMVQLLSIACLSIASKFNETSAPSLNEIQKRADLDFCFRSNIILQMELILLQALEWRLNAVTSYSIIESLTCNDWLEPHLQEKLVERVVHFLLQAVLDPKWLEFRGSSVAISAFWCSLDQFCPQVSGPLLALVDKYVQKDDLLRCRSMMEEQTKDCGCFISRSPSSPTTVLLRSACTETNNYQ